MVKQWVSYQDATKAHPEHIKRFINEHQSLLRRETEEALRELNCEYHSQRERYWNRDYSSIEAYEASVEPNRKRWLELIGDFSENADGTPLEPQYAPFMETDAFNAQWAYVRIFKNLRAHAILALPKRGSPPFPLVICQHGIGSAPEYVFGFADDGNYYHGFGRMLVERGFAVLAPMHITTGQARARYHRLCLLIGKTLFGLEIYKLQRLLDFALSDERIDCERVGMWGLSLGGAYTMFAVPIEQRIRVAIISAFFNHRLKKMVIDDPRYSCFLSTQEEHIFIPGWLREFSDSDLLSLICPRPVMVQAGKCDGIAWHPFLVEEFEWAREHYRRLGIEERCVLDLHEGGHEIHFDAGYEFLKRWLLNAR